MQTRSGRISPHNRLVGLSDATHPVVFRSPWDGFFRAVFGLYLFGYLLNGAVLVFSEYFWFGRGSALQIGLGFLAMLVLVGILGATRTPRRFVIEGWHLRIQCWLRSVKIPLLSIYEAESVPKQSSEVANGAQPGHPALDRSEVLLKTYRGLRKVYATRTRGRVHLRTPTGVVVISPDSPEEFLAVLRHRRQLILRTQ